MLSAAKHFPGHGDTGTDSHVALPVITASARAPRLGGAGAVPRRGARGHRRGDDRAPRGRRAERTRARLPPRSRRSSSTRCSGSDLGFQGLVVTDALNMGAIVSRYGASQAAVMALKAGADILLMPVDAKGAIDAVTDAVARGEVSEARLDSSVARVLAAKARVGLFQDRLVDIDRVAAAVGAANRRRAGAGHLAAQPGARQGLVSAWCRSSAARRRHVLVSRYGNESVPGRGRARSPPSVRSAVDTLRTFRLWPASGPASLDSVARRGRGARARSSSWPPPSPRPGGPTPWTSPDPSPAWWTRSPRTARPSSPCRSAAPTCWHRSPTCPTYVAAWSDTDFIEHALARALLGMAPITGQSARHVASPLSRRAPACREPGRWTRPPAAPAAAPRGDAPPPRRRSRLAMTQDTTASPWDSLERYLERERGAQGVPRRRRRGRTPRHGALRARLRPPGLRATPGRRRPDRSTTSPRSPRSSASPRP